MDGKLFFEQMNPDFFNREYIRQIDNEHVYEEQALDLREYAPDALSIPVPGHITFGYFEGDLGELQASVALVNEEWLKFYQDSRRVFCAFDGERPVSFCRVEDMGEHEIFGRKVKIGGPGCVGTIPAYRRQGIGLKMVQYATNILKSEGYDYSYIHYTGVGHWYARLGYETLVRWNKYGPVD